ncbi:MAG: cation:proton antiporter [Methanomicrobia archaeon]|nr:cation:proton antiporter [Methanomicrobia archaeon]
MMIFIYVVVIFSSAMLFGEIAERLNQPNIIGELLGGIIVGPIAYGIFSLILSPDHSFFEYWRPEIVESEIKVLIEIGMVMVMLIAGLGTELEDLIASGRYSILPAIFGVIIPFTLGYSIGIFFDYSTITALFIGASLSITAVAVSAKTLLDLKKLRSRIGVTILGAAIIDDVLGLIILSVLLSLVHGETFSFVGILIIVLKSIGFLFIAVKLGGYLLPKILRYRLKFGKEMRLGMVLLIVLIFSILARISGLHEMIGAFIVGMLLKKVLTEGEIDNLVTWGLGFFTPLFFGWIGFAVTFSSVLSLLMAVILAAAIIGKVLGCGIGAYISGLSPKESTAVGVGMNGRGAVELVLAGVGLEFGIIQQDLFSIIVFMAFFTTIITPIALKMTLRSAEKDKKHKKRG